MPSVFSHSAVVAGLPVGAPGSLIAPGRTLTETVDDAFAEDATWAAAGRAGEAAATTAERAAAGPATGELTAAGPAAVADAAVAAAIAVMPAARVNLALCIQTP
jgi:hypothetical protein